ncbi:MAG: MobF family relaxase [Sporichthyaceae bacterium]
MLTISSGHSATYLTDAVATGRENYYSGAVAAGEPPGRWYGTGAEGLGLVGTVHAQDMTALFAHFVDPCDPGFRTPTAWPDAATLGHRGRAYIGEEELYRAAYAAEPHATAERRAELRLDAGRRARRNVAFMDATFSVQKSITVLHTAFEAQEVAARRRGDVPEATAWASHREAVESAIWAGSRAALDYLAAHAGYSRVGHHGGAAGRYIDAHDLVIASFFQHDSRDHDPQLHVHNAILNRVQGSDGVWRTLDGRSLYVHRGAAAAVGERTTEEYLARTLGVRFATRPDGKAREILGVPQDVMDLFSSRRRAITAKTQELVTAFETRFDRAPNALELDRLQRQATFATRKAKTHRGESVEARLDRWDRELRAEIDGGLRRVAHDVLSLAGHGPTPEDWSRPAVIATALADVQARKAAWTAPDLTRAISDALPDRLGDLDGTRVATLLDGLTAEALDLATPITASRPGHRSLPDDLKLADGRSAYDAPGRRLFTTPEHVRSERLLRDASIGGAAHTVAPATIRHLLASLRETGLELGVDQTAAVRGVLGSGAALECLVGPAGTGKSFVVGVLAKGWTQDGGRVFGLASSQAATEVLLDEGLQARNIARWLTLQQHLDTTVGGPDEAWRLTPHDLVVIDESAMTNTADLARVHARVAAAQSKLLLVGDPRQLAAVGAGGAMAMLTENAHTYQLTEARRFAQPWEANGSLRLREGDTTALGEYHKHGRLLDCGTLDSAERSAATAWLADTLGGHRSLLVVDTNDQAARLNAALRAELVRLGRVAEPGVPLDREGTVAAVGDLVQARQNAWHLTGHRNNRRGPVNREHLRVLDTYDDGALRVAPVVGRNGEADALGDPMHLPADYVREHLSLGYCATAHGAQGRTVDTAHVVVGPATRSTALYVGLTRGRHANTAHVTTVSVPADAPPGALRESMHRSPLAVLGAVFDDAATHRSALVEQSRSSDEAQSLRAAAELFADAVEVALAGRTASWLDALVHDGHLDVAQRTQFANEDAGPALDRLMRRVELAGHDPERVLRAAVTERPLDGSRQLSNVVAHRICAAFSTEPVYDHFADRVPVVQSPQWRSYLEELASTADARVHRLGVLTSRQEPQWAVENLGPVPAESGPRAEWIRRAGIVAAHREFVGFDGEASPLGEPPKPGQAEATASWCAAWRALGGEARGREEAEMSTGQLLVRIRAWDREQNWAPRYVANELAATSQAVAAAERTAALRVAESSAAPTAAERVDLTRQANEAAALARALHNQCVDLAEADDVRARWYAHTAATRAAAERAQLELATREPELPDEPRVTAEQWLDAHRAANRAEDPHRRITRASDFAHLLREQAAERAALDGVLPTPNRAPAIRRPPAASTASEDEVRVPTTEQTAATLMRARAALDELQRREVGDARRAAEESRAIELTRRQLQVESARDLEDERAIAR